MNEEPQQPQTGQPEVQEAQFPDSTRARSKRPVIIAICAALLVVILVGVAIGLRDNKGSTNNVKTSPLPSLSTTQTAQVAVAASGFMPETISITKGQSVTWTNTDTAQHAIASDPFPQNDRLPGLNSGPMKTNQTFTYVFSETGTFTYHDQNNPTKVLGTVKVTDK